MKRRLAALLSLALLAVAALGLAGPTPGRRTAIGPVAPVFVPYRLSDTQHLLVRARLNGKGPFTFILDTGAPALIVSTDIARQTRATRQGAWATFNRVEIEGGLRLDKERAMVMDPFQLEAMNSIGLSDEKLAGVIGYTVLAKFRIAIDLRRSHLVWTRVPYRPPPPVSLLDLTGGRPLAAAPDQARMEGAAAWAGSMLGKRSPSTVVTRGFLGIELDAREDACVVRAVPPGGPAAAAGVKEGDVILSAQLSADLPTELAGPSDLLKMLKGMVAGDVVQIKVHRGETNHDLTIRAMSGGL